MLTVLCVSESVRGKTGAKATIGRWYGRLDLFFRATPPQGPPFTLAASSGMHPPKRDGYEVRPYVIGIRLSVASWFWSWRYYVRLFNLGAAPPRSNLTGFPPRPPGSFDLTTAVPPSILDP